MFTVLSANPTEAIKTTFDTLTEAIVFFANNAEMVVIVSQQGAKFYPSQINALMSDYIINEIVDAVEQRNGYYLYSIIQ